MRIVVAVAFLLAFSARALAAVPPERLREAHEALGNWQVEPQRPLVDEIERSALDDPEALYFLAHFYFLTGEYAKASQYLMNAGGDRGRRGVGFESALKAAEEITRGYVEVVDEHFVVRHAPGVDELMVPWALQTLRAQRKALAADLGHVPNEKRIVLELYPDTATLAKATGIGTDKLETSGTIAICKFNRLMVTSPRALMTGYRWRDTVAHEFTHLIISQKSRNTVPIWLHEGIAKFEERRWRSPPGGALTPHAETLLGQALKENDLVTYAQMHPSMAYLPSQEAASLAFAEVLTTLQFLHAERGGYPKLQLLLTTLARTDDLDASLKAAYGFDLAGLEQRWKQYLKGRTFAIDPDLAVERFTFAKRGRVSEAEQEVEEEKRQGISDPQARGWATLGKLFKDRERFEAARIELEKAAGRTNRRNVRVQTLLADVYLQLKRFVDGVQALGSMGERIDGNLRAQLLLGAAYAGAERWREAEGPLVEAVGINPFDPRVWQLLGAVYTKLGRTGDAAAVEKSLEALTAHLRRAAGE